MQGLGQALTVLIQTAGQIQSNPNDAYAKKELSQNARNVSEQVCVLFLYFLCYFCYFVFLKFIALTTKDVFVLFILQNNIVSPLTSFSNFFAFVSQKFLFPDCLNLFPEQIVSQFFSKKPCLSRFF